MESEHLPTQSSSLVKPTVAAAAGTILGVEVLDVEVLCCRGYAWSAVEPVGCTANLSKTPLETADVEKRTFNSA